MKLYIATKIQNFIIGYVEFTISSTYKEWKDCIDNSLVDNGSHIIVVCGDRFINATVTDKAAHSANIISEGSVELLERNFRIIKSKEKEAERVKALEAQRAVLENIVGQFVEAEIYGPAHVLVQAKLEAIKNELRVLS